MHEHTGRFGIINNKKGSQPKKLRAHCCFSAVLGIEFTADAKANGIPFRRFGIINRCGGLRPWSACACWQNVAPRLVLQIELVLGGRVAEDEALRSLSQAPQAARRTSRPAASAPSSPWPQSPSVTDSSGHKKSQKYKPRAPPRLVLEVEIAERVPVGVADG